jgi:transposase InsO family protein
MPRIGGKKLYYLLSKDFERLAFKLGRNKFFEVLQQERLLVRPRKRGYKTTDSGHQHRVYPNLVQNCRLYRPFQVLVADITYVRLEEGFCFLSLVTDLFSRAIIGWFLSRTLDAGGPIAALKAARLVVGAAVQGCIHHSDQGVQYCSADYVRLLFRFKMKISMTHTGSPGENAVAERVNGILKTELLLDGTFRGFADALPATREAISIYNHERPHYSLDLATPAKFLAVHRRKTSRR